MEKVVGMKRRQIFPGRGAQYLLNVLRLGVDLETLKRQ
jgi:hypothetical protein